MASLMELVDRVNKGDMVEPEQLELYQESSNSAEKFLAHHAHGMLDLRKAHQHLLQSLEAIDYSDQKVLGQFMSISGFLNLSELRAGPVVKFGASAIARREYALGLEAIQNGVSYDLQFGGTYTSDRDNCLFVAQQYARVAQCAGWVNPTPGEWNNKITRVAYVTSGIADDECSGRTIRSLAKHHDTKRFKLHVYSTEAGVRRDKQQFGQSSYLTPTSRRGGSTLEVLARLKVSNWIAGTEGDLLTAAMELANNLVKDRIDVIIFDANQADPIAAVVADWDVAKLKINLVRKTPLYASGIKCVSYTDQVRFEADQEFWNRKGVESKFILEGINLDDELGTPPTRSAYGIPENAMVLSTVGTDLDRTLTGEFVDTVINLLRAHPHAIYLLVGEGELAWQKRKFESAGVGKRIGYAGKRKDLPGFIRMADLYLAEFPTPSSQGVLFAMAVEKPVVTARWGDSAEQSQAAAFVGAEATLSSRDSSAYIERVSKLIREPVYRAKLGKTMRTRVEQHFSFAQTAKHLEQLCEQLLQQQSSEGSVTLGGDESDGAGPMSQVA